MVELKEYTKEQVAQNNSEQSFWVICDGLVYDLTNFLGMHPGGELILHPYGGQDITEPFYALHRHEVLQKFGPKYLIGKLEGKDGKPKIAIEAGQLSRVPYAEASVWDKRWFSPYFNDSHRRFKLAVRKFFDEVIIPEARENDDAGFVFSSVYHSL